MAELVHQFLSPELGVARGRSTDRVQRLLCLTDHLPDGLPFGDTLGGEMTVPEIAVPLTARTAGSAGTAVHSTPRTAANCRRPTRPAGSRPGTTPRSLAQWDRLRARV